MLTKEELTTEMVPLSACNHGDSVPPRHQYECILRCRVGKGRDEGGPQGAAKRDKEEGDDLEVRVTCVGKKDGQATAAQAMLKVQSHKLVFSTFYCDSSFPILSYFRSSILTSPTGEHF